MKLSSCLARLGITDGSFFDECDDIGEEFKAIKKTYFKKILREHPDKGGDPASFRATNAAFEVVRDLYHTNCVNRGTFTSYLRPIPNTRSTGGASSDDEEEDESYYEDEDDSDLDDLYAKYSNNANAAPSYEYYEAAAEEDVPGYKVELAKSGRSKCVKCQSKIEKDGIRVGSLDKVSGTYGRWNHLDCWRVPVKVQNGLTNPSDEDVSLIDILSMEEILLTGVDALDDASKRLFAQHCVNRDNWAGNRKRRRNQIMGEPTTDSGAEQAAAASKATKVAAKSEAASEAAKKGKSKTPPPVAASSATGNNNMPGNFVVLVPGVDGALHDDKFLRNQTFLITGTFPEVGGGDADALGVANVKAMIQSYGGKVISRFSTKTNFLLVGKDPVARKFNDASKRSVGIISLPRLQGLLLGHVSLEALKNMPALSSDVFMGNAYEPAGAPPPHAPNNADQKKVPSKPSANATFSKQSATKGKAAAAKMSPKPNLDVAGPVAAAVSSKASSTAASANTQVMVTHANPSKRSNSSSAIVPRNGKKAKFTVPLPGVNGAVADVLGGKRFVLTGVFPELGGGTGLTLGKDRTTNMIESFGGRVTSAVSGKTDFVVVGKDPGRSKVAQADKRGVTLLDLLSLTRLLMGQSSLEGVKSEPPPRITGFSAGYSGQGRIAY